MANVGCFGVEAADPSLTHEGVWQCEKAREFIDRFPHWTPNISFSSTLTRAFQTAALTFHQTVHVADFIPSAKPAWGSMPSCLQGHLLSDFSSCSESPAKQLEFLRLGRHVSGQSRCDAPPTPDLVSQIDWSYWGGMPQNYTMGHPFAWRKFLNWLWQNQAIKNLLMQDANPALISITTGGMSWRRLFIFRGWKTWAGNAGIYTARLPLLYSGSGELLGFKMVEPVEAKCIWQCGSTPTFSMFV